jgi:hypothetical protein
VTSVLVLSCLIYCSCPIISACMAYDFICRRGVCVFVGKGLYFNRISICKKKKDLEIYAAELDTEASKLIIVAYMELLQEILINS